MKRVLLIAGIVAISTAAFAQANGPIRQGNKCWAVTDQQRGFGFWDNCADSMDCNALLSRKLEIARAAQDVFWGP